MAATAALATDQTWKGAISDKMCGADHKKMAGKMSDRDCTQACAKGGSPYVLVSDGTVYQLTNHDAELRAHAGHVVNLTGERGDSQGFKGRVASIIEVALELAVRRRVTWHTIPRAKAARHSIASPLARSLT